MIDKGIDLLPEVTGQVVVFLQDAALQGLVPSLHGPAVHCAAMSREGSCPEFAGDTGHLERDPSVEPPTALLDRLTHRCHIRETNNDSYRFKPSAEAAKKTGKETATLTAS